MTYDKSINELEKIVNKLSDEKLGMEESIELYSQGILLAKDAMKELSVFKGKIEILNKDMSELEAETEEAETDDDE